MKMQFITISSINVNDTKRMIKSREIYQKREELVSKSITNREEGATVSYTPASRC